MYEEILVNGNEYMKEYIRAKRALVLNAYGNKCVCCGETTNEFLAIDHIENNGSKHRKEVTGGNSGNRFYGWIIRNNFPEGLQILCHNCNMAKGFYGKCPHEDKKCT